jgi:hypothetical protein
VIAGRWHKSEYKAKIFAMPSASAIRFQIETALAHRVPSALTPMLRVPRPVAPTGIAAVDDLLEGGLPVGAITEFVGPECSGRTSLALTFLARMTRMGSVCAWIDVCDGMDPESTAATGIDLSRLLWVRCGGSAEPPRFSTRFQFPQKYLAPPQVQKEFHGGLGPHSQAEVKEPSEAVSDLLRPENFAPRCAEPQRRMKPERKDFMPISPMPAAKLNPHVRSGKPWRRIEQALRVADLLLQAGGFSAIVLDMAGVAPEYSARVPIPTWFRYRAAAERTQTSLLLLTQHSCAKSSAELLLRFQPGSACDDETTVFTGIEHRLEVEQRRFTQVHANIVPMRKPPQRESDAHWRTRSTWAGVR